MLNSVMLASSKLYYKRFLAEEQMNDKMGKLLKQGIPKRLNKHEVFKKFRLKLQIRFEIHVIKTIHFKVALQLGDFQQ